LSTKVIIKNSGSKKPYGELKREVKKGQNFNKKTTG